MESDRGEGGDLAEVVGFGTWSFMTSLPWKAVAVEEATAGYYRGEVWGGHDFEYLICSTEFAATAEAIVAAVHAAASPLGEETAT